MQFMDELRGSVGERCKVTNTKTGEEYEGTIIRLHEATGTVTVEKDDKELVSQRRLVHYRFVELFGEEDDAK